MPPIDAKSPRHRARLVRQTHVGVSDIPGEGPSNREPLGTIVRHQRGDPAPAPGSGERGQPRRPLRGEPAHRRARPREPAERRGDDLRRSRASRRPTRGRRPASGTDAQPDRGRSRSSSRCPRTPGCPSRPPEHAVAPIARRTPGADPPPGRHPPYPDPGRRAPSDHRQRHHPPRHRARGRHPDGRADRGVPRSPRHRDAPRRRPSWLLRVGRRLVPRRLVSPARGGADVPARPDPASGAGHALRHGHTTSTRPWVGYRSPAPRPSDSGSTRTGRPPCPRRT